jgi:hypothetical protein
MYRRGKKFKAPFILWIILLKKVCWKYPNSDLNSQWKTLSNTLYSKISSMNLEGKMFKILKDVFFRSLKSLQKLIFDNTMLKSTKFWTKRGLAAIFTAFPWEVISITKDKKTWLLWKFLEIDQGIKSGILESWNPRILANLWESLRIQDFALFQKQNISVPYFGNISQKAEQKCPILGKNSWNSTKLFCFWENAQNRTKLLFSEEILRNLRESYGI